jgi:AmmeMemoRadiSam system protein A
MAGGQSGIAYACISPHPPVIVPEVGRGREAETARTIEALRQVAGELNEQQPETVLIISPHGPIRPDAMGISTAPRAIGGFLQWGAPGVSFTFDNDPEAVSLLQEEASAAGLPLTAVEDWGLNLDWGCTVPLYYLRSGMRGACLVPMAISFLSPQAHYVLGKAVGRALTRLGRTVAIICSADLSHALIPGAPNDYDPAGHQFDERYRRAVEEWDVDWMLHVDSSFRHHAAEDAVPQTSLLMGALSDLEVHPRVLSYEGPFGVGYLVAAIDVLGPREASGAEPAAAGAAPAYRTGRPAHPTGLPAGPETAQPVHPYVALAREAVEGHVRYRQVVEPFDLTPEMRRRAAAFVSIKKLGDLRGCIGTVEPAYVDLAHEIIQNAIAAATRDPRFEPVVESELPHLTYSVDILTPPERIDGPEALDPRRYGVIVQSGRRRGLLLPDLPGVDSVEEQVAIARAKGGILPGELADLYRFQVERYG